MIDFHRPGNQENYVFRSPEALEEWRKRVFDVSSQVKNQALWLTWDRLRQIGKVTSLQNDTGFPLREIRKRDCMGFTQAENSQYKSIYKTTVSVYWTCSILLPWTKVLFMYPKEVFLLSVYVPDKLVKCTKGQDTEKKPHKLFIHRKQQVWSLQFYLISEKWFRFFSVQSSCSFDCSV